MSTRVAIITGASKGIGKSTASLLAQKGYSVCINYNNNSSDSKTQAEDLSDTINFYNKDTSVSAIAVQADVSDKKQVTELFKKTHSWIYHQF